MTYQLSQPDAPRLPTDAERLEAHRQYRNHAIPPWWQWVSKLPCDCDETRVIEIREEKPHFTFYLIRCPHKRWGYEQQCNNVMEG